MRVGAWERIGAFVDACGFVVDVLKRSIWPRDRGAGGLIVVLAASLAMAGCAEFTHRGGILAQIADKAVFPASAKGHRVLRAYVILAALVTVANNRGLPSGDKLSFQGRVYQTLDGIQQSFTCAYATPSGCIFFDEKMARVDYNLYKLALNVLITSESRALVIQLQRELLPKVPVVGSTLLAASSAADAAGHVVTAGVETEQIVESLISLGYQAADSIGPLFPLYRDAQELDMVVVVDMLARRCAASSPTLNGVTRDALAFRDNLYAAYSSGTKLADYQECTDFLDGMKLYKSGNGYLESWRQFTKTMSAHYLADMTPSGDHFLEVSSMISSACQQMFTASGTVMDKKSTSVATNCSKDVLYSGTATGSLKIAEDSAAGLSFHSSSPVPAKIAVVAASKTASVVGSNVVKNSKAKLTTIPLE